MATYYEDIGRAATPEEVAVWGYGAIAGSEYVHDAPPTPFRQYVFGEKAVEGEELPRAGMTTDEVGNAIYKGYIDSLPLASPVKQSLVSDVKKEVAPWLEMLGVTDVDQLVKGSVESAIRVLREDEAVPKLPVDQAVRIESSSQYRADKIEAGLISYAATKEKPSTVPVGVWYIDPNTGIAMKATDEDLLYAVAVSKTMAAGILSPDAIAVAVEKANAMGPEAYYATLGDMNSFSALEEERIGILDMQVKTCLPYARRLVEVALDETLDAQTRQLAVTNLERVGIDYTAVQSTSEGNVDNMLYKAMASQFLNEMGLQDKYTVSGLNRAIYNTAELDKTVLSIQRLEENYPAYNELVNRLDWNELLKRDLRDRLGAQLDTEKINRIVENYPFLAISLLAGDTSIQDAYAFLNTVEERTTYTRDIGWMDTDDHIAWANVVVEAKTFGASDEECYALLSQIRNTLSEEDKANFDNWIASEWFESDQGTVAMVSHPGRTMGSLSRNQSLQGSVVAGTVLSGAASGFVVAGPAGALGGALMGVFAGTEVFNLANTNVFAEKQIRQMQSLGVENPAESIKGFNDRNKQLSQQYGDALKRGDLQAANNVAAKGLELANEFSGWIWDNKYAFQKAGVLNGLRDDVTAGYNTWEGSLIGNADGETNVGPIYALPDGYNPARDSVTVNGVEIPGLDSTRLMLPPGEYVIGVTMGSFAPQFDYITIDAMGVIDTSTAEEVAMLRVPITGLEPITPGYVDVALSKTLIEQRTEAIMSATGLVVPVLLADGYTYKDPNTGEWTDSGVMTLHGLNPIWIEVMDPDGYMRSTRIDPRDVIEPLYVQIDETIPYVKGPSGQSQIIENAFTAKYGEDKGGLRVDTGLDNTVTVYVDGVEVLPGTVVPLTVGTHTVVGQRVGYEDEVRTVEVQKGLVETVVSVPRYGAVQQKTVVEQLYPITGLVQIDPSLPTDWTYVLDGEIVIPGQEVVLDPGTHALTVNRPGYELEYKTFAVNAGEVHVMGEIPSYQLKQSYTSSYGGSYGGGSGGGGGGGLKQENPTTISFGSIATSCRIWIDRKEIVPVKGQAYKVEKGFHLIDVVCPDGTGIETQVLAVAEQNSYVNPKLVEITEDTTWLFAEALTEGKVDLTAASEEAAAAAAAAAAEAARPTFYVSVSSEPEGAKILVNGAFVGEWTPARIVLKEGLYELGLYKSGYVQFAIALWVSDTPATGEEALVLAGL